MSICFPDFDKMERDENRSMTTVCFALMKEMRPDFELVIYA